jgi:hypothetical protein
MMKLGKAVFDSDFIYPMYHIVGGDPNTNPDAEKVWARVVEKFIELCQITDNLSGYHAVFTADERIRDYLKEQGLHIRTLTKVFEHKGERKSLSNSVDLDQDTEAVSE